MSTPPKRGRKNLIVHNDERKFWDGKNFSAEEKDAKPVSRAEFQAFTPELNQALYATPLKTPFTYCDGGWKESGIADANNCTVIALAIAAEIPYALADSIAAQAGRKRRRGVSMTKVALTAQKLGIVCRYKTHQGSIKTFLKRKLKGRYICYIRRHVFAVINGTIHDSKGLPPYSLVKSYLEFTPNP